MTPHNLSSTLPSTLSPNLSAARPSSHSAGSKHVVTGVLLITVAMLSFAPLAILTPAIGWPASLNKPAADQLSAIFAKGEAVSLGYSVYMLYSVLVAPAMIGLTARVFGGLSSTWAATIAGMAMLSTLARAIGILRWLTVMPALAVAYNAADPSARSAIELVFNATTKYGGGIGEILGVSVFMAIAVGMLSLGAFTQSSASMPKWLGGLGLISALLLGGLSLPAFGGPALVPVAAAVTLLSIWMLAAGVWCFKPQRD